jgi:hypothetical protein
LGTSGSEYGKNVTETEIIMSSLRKLILAKFVKYIELSGEVLILSITLRGKLDLNDNLSVRDHH